MDEVSPQIAPASSTATGAADASGDLREWLGRVEAIGELKRITAEVHWDQEMSAVAYLASQDVGGPALLFERIAGYPSGYRALWSLLGLSLPRIAITLGQPPSISMMELIQRCKTQLTGSLPPVFVEPAEAPINTHHLLGSDVDVTERL